MRQNTLISGKHVDAWDGSRDSSCSHQKAFEWWEYKKKWVIHSFWQGEEDVMMGATPNVQVGLATHRNELMPWAKTHIGIWYEPKQ